MIKDDYPKYRRRLLSKTGPGEDCFDLGRTRCGFTLCSQITYSTSTKGLYPLFPKTNSFKTSFIQNHKWTQSKFYPELTLTGVLILSKGKIADRIPIFFKVFYIVSHTPILPFERIKTSVDYSLMTVGSSA